MIKRYIKVDKEGNEIPSQIQGKKYMEIYPDAELIIISDYPPHDINNWIEIKEKVWSRFWKGKTIFHQTTINFPHKIRVWYKRVTE